MPSPESYHKFYVLNNFSTDVALDMAIFERYSESEKCKTQKQYTSSNWVYNINNQDTVYTFLDTEYTCSVNLSQIEAVEKCGCLRDDHLIPQELVEAYPNYTMCMMKKNTFDCVWDKKTY